MPYGNLSYLAEASLIRTFRVTVGICFFPYHPFISPCIITSPLAVMLSRFNTRSGIMFSTVSSVGACRPYFRSTASACRAESPCRLPFTSKRMPFTFMPVLFNVSLRVFRSSSRSVSSSVAIRCNNNCPSCQKMMLSFLNFNDRRDRSLCKEARSPSEAFCRLAYTRVSRSSKTTLVCFNATRRISMPPDKGFATAVSFTSTAVVSVFRISQLAMPSLLLKA